MIDLNRTTHFFFELFFSKKFRHRFERITLWLALIGFIVHFSLIILNNQGWLPFQLRQESLVDDPIKAIYTPFSFILIFEVYLLVYNLPQSFTASVVTQYEIIALIVVRRLFKDITRLQLKENWFDYEYNWLFTADLIGFLLLFFFIFLFRRLALLRPPKRSPFQVERFIDFKRRIAILLIPVLLGLAIYSFTDWLLEFRQFNVGLIEEIPDINNVFYDEFFTLLILVDVLVLIVSLFYSDDFIFLIRNSGFVISTILIRLSFSASGLVNIALIIVGAALGVLVLGIFTLLIRTEPD